MNGEPTHIDLNKEADVLFVKTWAKRYFTIMLELGERWASLFLSVEDDKISVERVNDQVVVIFGTHLDINYGGRFQVVDLIRLPSEVARRDFYQLQAQRLEAQKGKVFLWFA